MFIPNLKLKLSILPLFFFILVLFHLVTLQSSILEKNLFSRTDSPKSLIPKFSINTTTKNNNESSQRIKNRRNRFAVQSCCEGTFTMFIAIMSGPSEKKERNMIRTLWGSPWILRAVDAKLLFFIGQSKSAKMQKKIDSEYKSYKDIYQLDILDTYENLVNKSFLMMKYFNETCQNTKWYLKSDVNTFSNINLLKELLQSTRLKETLNLYLSQFGLAFPLNDNLSSSDNGGSISSGNISIVCPRARGLDVCREYSEDKCESRFIVSKEEYPLEKYPPHCHSFSYVLERNLVKTILEKDEAYRMEGRKRFRLEAVYATGILLGNNSPRHLDIL